jgi:uncharacterized delta-60 repeat protein
LARLNTDGSVDEGFAPCFNDTVLSVALQHDGRVVVGGHFNGIGCKGMGTFERNFVGRLDPDGSVDASFNPCANTWVNAVACQPDGKVLLGGWFTSLGSGPGTTPCSHIGRTNPDGSVDDAFNPGANSSVDAITLRPDGRIVVGGWFTSLGGGRWGTAPRSYVGCLHPDGSIDAAFDPGADCGVECFAVQADDRTLVGGWFTRLGGGGTGTTPRNNIGRIV